MLYTLLSGRLYPRLRLAAWLPSPASLYSRAYRSARAHATVLSAWTFSDVRGSSVAGKLNEIVMELSSRR